jgi:hypothetical protein
MKHEYHEGPKAGENFKRLATAVPLPCWRGLTKIRAEKEKGSVDLLSESGNARTPRLSPVFQDQRKLV